MTEGPVPRDRDATGRPRNARPRDELGRPLGPGVADAGDVPRIPDDLTVTPAEAAALGGSLLAEGKPFHAHEVFEAAWKSAPEPERDVLRLRGHEPGVDTVSWRVAAYPLRAAAKQAHRTAGVAATSVREADGDLRQAPPQLALGLRR